MKEHPSQVFHGMPPSPTEPQIYTSLAPTHLTRRFFQSLWPPTSPVQRGFLKQSRGVLNMRQKTHPEFFGLVASTEFNLTIIEGWRRHRWIESGLPTWWVKIGRLFAEKNLQWFPEVRFQHQHTHKMDSLEQMYVEACNKRKQEEFQVT